MDAEVHSPDRPSTERKEMDLLNALLEGIAFTHPRSSIIYTSYLVSRVFTELYNSKGTKVDPSLIKHIKDVVNKDDHGYREIKAVNTVSKVLLHVLEWILHPDNGMLPTSGTKCSPVLKEESVDASLSETAAPSSIVDVQSPIVMKDRMYVHRSCQQKEESQSQDIISNGNSPLANLGDPNLENEGEITEKRHMGSKSCSALIERSNEDKKTESKYPTSRVVDVIPSRSRESLLKRHHTYNENKIDSKNTLRLPISKCRRKPVIPDSKTYGCRWCGQRFTYQSDMLTHERLYCPETVTVRAVRLDTRPKRFDRGKMGGNLKEEQKKAEGDIKIEDTEDVEMKVG